MMQGFANYETWTVALIIDNDSDQSQQDATRAAIDGREAFREYIESEWFSRSDEDEYMVSSSSTNDMVAQLFQGAVSEIDWTGLRQHFANDMVWCDECDSNYDVACDPINFADGTIYCPQGHEVRKDWEEN